MAIQGGQVPKIGPGTGFPKSPGLSGKGPSIKAQADPTYDDTGSSFGKLMSQSSKRVQLKQLRGLATPSVRTTPLRVKR